MSKMQEILKSELFGSEARVTETSGDKGWPCPGWMPAAKTKPVCGSGVKRRYFDAQPDGKHGSSKRGWAPILTNRVRK